MVAFHLHPARQQTPASTHIVDDAMQGRISVGVEHLAGALAALPSLTYLDLQHEGQGNFSASAPLLHATTNLEVGCCTALYRADMLLYCMGYSCVP